MRLGQLRRSAPVIKCLYIIHVCGCATMTEDPTVRTPREYAEELKEARSVEKPSEILERLREIGVRE